MYQLIVQVNKNYYKVHYLWFLMPINIFRTARWLSEKKYFFKTNNLINTVIHTVEEKVSFHKLSYDLHTLVCVHTQYVVFFRMHVHRDVSMILSFRKTHSQKQEVQSNLSHKQHMWVKLTPFKRPPEEIWFFLKHWTICCHVSAPGRLNICTSFPATREV